ncbi:hypothetical protein FRC09_002720 [Ceratobasidium sp. 395]|nr:hypothetical protein FRC09_002720 [Ceratobasidium sp. 395]
MFRGDRESGWKQQNRVVDQDHSRRIAHAYTALLHVSQRDTSNVKVLSSDVMRRLGLFVFATMRPPTPLTSLQLTTLVCTSIEFFWLLLEHRPRISVLDWDDMMHNAGSICTVATALEKLRILSEKDKATFSKALGDADIHNLVGRTLLLVTLEVRMGNDSEEYVGLWEDFLSAVARISQSAAYSLRFAPDHLPPAKADWSKVWEQMEVLWGLSLADKDIVSKVRQRVVDMRRTWDMLHLVLDDDIGTPRKCAYPRCFRPVATKRLLGARWACEKCGDVAYCDRICQRA